MASAAGESLSQPPSVTGAVASGSIPKTSGYRSHWAPEKKTIHILPHWNWPERIGKNTPVYVYTNGDSAELFLNGASLGWKVLVGRGFSK